MKWTKHEAQEASQLLTVLSSTFNRELDEAGLTGYLMGMEDIPVSAIRTAVSRAIREQRFMPTVAELRRLAGEMDPEARAITAWACVRDQIGKVGAYRSITFTDGAINAAIRQLGGWVHLCEQTTEALDRTISHQFKKSYGALIQYGMNEELAAPLFGICDQTNGHRGLKDMGPARVTVNAGTGAAPIRRIEKPVGAGITVNLKGIE